MQGKFENLICKMMKLRTFRLINFAYRYWKYQDIAISLVWPYSCFSAVYFYFSCRCARSLQKYTSFRTSNTLLLKYYERNFLKQKHVKSDIESRMY